MKFLPKKAYFLGTGDLCVLVMNLCRLDSF